MTRLLASLAVLGCTLGACAQIGDPPVRPKNYVMYAAESQAVRAGKTGVLDVRFHVLDGFHVNSHQPKSELLIPTVLKLDAADGVKPGALAYPPGQLYSFSFEPSEKLDVYAGDFTVKLPVVAAAGEHTVNAVLQYQACDNSACYPPKKLPVQILFTAK